MPVAIPHMGTCVQVPQAMHGHVATTMRIHMLFVNTCWQHTQSTAQHCSCGQTASSVLCTLCHGQLPTYPPTAGACSVCTQAQLLVNSGPWGNMSQPAPDDNMHHMGACMQGPQPHPPQL